MSNCPVSVKPICECIGVRLDTKLSFVSHLDDAKKILRKQYGIIFKIGQCVTIQKAIWYHKSIADFVLGYGVLV